jgi:nucleoside-diphosphate-sugar epimerase
MTETVDIICKIIGWKPTKFKFETNMPVGALSRALDNSRAAQLLGWKPRFTLEEGLKRTIEWYVSTHKSQIGNTVKQQVLLER